MSLRNISRQAIFMQVLRIIISIKANQIILDRSFQVDFKLTVSKVTTFHLTHTAYQIIIDTQISQVSPYLYKGHHYSSHIQATTSLYNKQKYLDQTYWAQRNLKLKNDSN